MSISYNGIGQVAVTFPAGSCAVGQVCKLDTSGRAAACSSCDQICGVVQAMEHGMAAVILEGFVQVNYTGSTPDYGMNGLLADGYGGVFCDPDAPSYLVVEVDTAAGTCVIKL